MPSRTRLLNSLIEEALDSELPNQQFEAILRFLPVANIQLLRHSLKELKGAARKAGRADVPARLHRVYHRKLAEQAALYPIFHVFETAYRAKLGFWMENHYQAATWWDPIVTKLQDRDRLRSSVQVDNINGVSVSNGTIRAMENFVKNVEGERLDRNILARVSGPEVFSYAKLSDIEELIYEQWTNFKNELRPTLSGGRSLEQQIFKAKFKRVREARNEAYHHREVARRDDIIATAEELLDLIDVHLGGAVESLIYAGYKFPDPNVAREARHIALNDSFPTFRVQTIHGNQGLTRQYDVVAPTSGDALAKQIALVSKEQRKELTQIGIVLQVEAALITQDRANATPD